MGWECFVMGDLGGVEVGMFWVWGGVRAGARVGGNGAG